MFEHLDITAILNFGFLGLSFLMLFLGYSLIRAVVKKDKETPGQMALARFFLWISVAFMVLAGPLQWVTIYIDDLVKEHTVVLYVGAQNPTWSDEYGEVYFSGKGKLLPISRKMEEITFADNDEVRIELSAVIDAINKMRESITRLNKERITNSPEGREALEGG